MYTILDTINVPIIQDDVLAEIPINDIIDEVDFKPVFETKVEAVVIYNPASPDSIIAAAIVAGQRGIKYALPAGDGVVKSHFGAFYWIGVQPSKATMAALKDKEHHGYFYMEDQAPQDMVVTTRAIDKMVHEIDIPYPKTLVFLAIEDFKECSAQTYGKYWKLANAVDDLMTCNPRMTLEDQALVYENTNNALLAMAAGISFDSVEVFPRSMTNYLGFLKLLKLKINQLWSMGDFMLKGEHYTAPTINIGSDLMPWAIKVISCAYPTVVAYEHTKNQKTYTIFSKDDVRRTIIEASLTEQLGNNRNAELVFSGYL